MQAHREHPNGTCLKALWNHNQTMAGHVAMYWFLWLRVAIIARYAALGVTILDIWDPYDVNSDPNATYEAPVSSFTTSQTEIMCQFQ